jgi:hypothetical protein
MSNDADLQVPVTMAMKMDVPVIVVNPHRSSGQKDCLIGSETRNLKKRHLLRSQMPQQVIDAKGRVIRRPTRWDP